MDPNWQNMMATPSRAIVRPPEVDEKSSQAPIAGSDALCDPGRVVRDALRTYGNEFWSCMSLTWSLWIPIHCVTFSIVPQHLRVHFSAVCSFFTLAAMSVLQGRLEKRRGVEPERMRGDV